MDSFDKRFLAGKQFERRFEAFLAKNHIHFSRLGTEKRDPNFSKRLVHDDSPAALFLRYQPDFYVFGQPSALIDVKYTDPDHKYLNLERRAIHWYKLYGVSVFIVAGDFHVYDANNLPEMTLVPQRDRISGSGNAFYMVPKCSGIPVKKFFGDARWRFD